MTRARTSKPVEILLIEDNVAEATLLREMLADSGSFEFELTHVQKLADGVGQLAKKPFDVVLLDLGLPDSSGIDTFAKLYQQAPGVPVLVLTGLDDETVGVKAIRQGAQYYLVKNQVQAALLGRSIRFAIERHQVIAALHESQMRFAGIINAALDGIITFDQQQHIVLFNPAAEKMFGYSAAEMLDQPLDRLIPERFRNAHGDLTNIFGQTYVTGRIIAGSDTVYGLRANNEEFPIEASISQVKVTEGELYTIILRDITERKRYERALYAEKERAQVTLQSIGDAVITTDSEGCVDYLNPIAEALTGWSSSEARRQPLNLVFPIVNEHTREPAVNPVARCLAEERIVGLADYSVLLNRRGSEYFIEDSAAPIRDARGHILGAVLVFHDVSEQRRLAAEMAHHTVHDLLTGLVNRREFERRLERTINTARTDRSEHALCYLDLDQFKVINDSCGHAAGDELLREIAKLLTTSIRQRDTLARLGGDEFGLLLEHCSLAQAQRIAQDLLNSLEKFRFIWEAKSFHIGASIGLVPISIISGNLTAVMQAADSACYVAKEAGRNRIHIYTPDDTELARLHGELQWVNHLQEALENNSFRLYAQRIAPLQANAADGLHCELLLRLPDHNGKLITPALFMPAAERYNLATRVDRWVVEHACLFFAEHPQRVAMLELFAINLSGNSLNDTPFQTFIMQQLDRLTIPAEKICFEITETAAIANLSTAARFIEKVKARGCRFALDDFGSGLSSFGYLKTLPVDFLKIDGIFVKDIVDDPIDFAMVRSINEIGQLMKKQTIAEYVENQAIFDKLQRLGVNYAQGYGIAHPCPLEDLLIEP